MSRGSVVSSDLRISVLRTSERTLRLYAQHITSPDPAIAPAIKPNYLSNLFDLEVLTHGFMKVDKLAHSAHLTKYIDVRQSPPPDVKGPAEMRKYVEETFDTSFRYIGRCALFSCSSAGRRCHC